MNKGTSKVLSNFYKTLWGEGQSPANVKKIADAEYYQ